MIYCTRSVFKKYKIKNPESLLSPIHTIVSFVLIDGLPTCYPAELLLMSKVPFLRTNYMFKWGLWGFERIFTQKSHYSRLLCYQILNSPVFSSADRHVTTGLMPRQPNILHVRLLCTLHCNTAHPRISQYVLDSGGGKRSAVKVLSWLSMAERT